MPRIGDNHFDLKGLTHNQIRKLPNDAFRNVVEQVLMLEQADRQEMQLLYYQPASEAARKIHESDARIIGVGGGNRSSKTETVLAELCALATGVLPISIRDELLEKFRGPINVRIVMESFTTVLEPIILPKLQWFKWVGMDEPGGDRGHWGWIPKGCLIEGSWEKSWSSKLRTLRVICRDPDNYEKGLGESIIQIMSIDQDWSDFASGTFHHIMHDEPPSHAIWKENRARTLDVSGRTFLVMTWPDDPSINVDWVFDEVYEPGCPGPNKDPEVEWIVLRTVDNRTLDPEAVISMTKSWDETTKMAKLEGQPIRFSNRIHPFFTDINQWWSFQAGKNITPVGNRCPITNSEDIVEYNHVKEIETATSWPVVFLLDPHPRKPHMFLWIMIDPSDDWYIIAEGAEEGDCGETKRTVEEIEEQLSLNVMARLIDPNMARSPSSSQRGITWKDDFDATGLICDLADDSGVGRQTINSFLKPDPQTWRPRIHLHPRCQNTIWQIKRYTWAEYKHTIDRDQKQTPREKYDDYPTLMKYCANFNPTFAFLHRGAPIIKKSGTRKGAY